MLALLVVPVVEVFIILKVGQQIGGLSTFLLLLFWSALGAWVVKREFSRAFGSLRQAFGSGRMPARELSDAALVLIGGTLLLAPGFLTDALGLFVLLPFTRPLTRRLLEGAVAHKLFGASPLGAAAFGAANAAPGRVRFTRVRAADAGGSSAAGPLPAPGPYPTADAFATQAGRDAAWNSPRRGASDVVEGEIID